MHVFIHVIYLVITILLMPSKYGIFDAFRVSGILIVVSVSVLTEWLIFTRKKNFLRLDVLFVMGFLIVHFQWPLMYLCGVRMKFMSIESSVMFMNYGTWLAAMGLIAWFIGWAAFDFKKRQRPRIVSVDYRRLEWLFYFLVGLFLITVDRDYITGAVYRGELEAGNVSGAAQGVAAYIQLLLGFVVAIVVAYFLPITAARMKKSNQPWKEINPFMVALLAAYMLLYLYVGDRGGAVQIGCVILVIFGMMVRPISFKQFLVLACIGAIVLTIIGWGRSSLNDKGERNIIAAGLEKIEELDDRGLYIYTLTLADSVTCLHSAIGLVEANGGIFWGKLWRGDLLAVVPLMGQSYMKIFSVSTKDMSSSSYLTNATFGENAKVGSGSTIIADLYFNWGVLGIPVFMFGLGVLYQRITKGVENRESMMWLVLAAALASIAFYSARANFFLFLRPLLWSWIIAKIFTKVTYSDQLISSVKARSKP